MLPLLLPSDHNCSVAITATVGAQPYGQHHPLQEQNETSHPRIRLETDMFLYVERFIIISDEQQLEQDMQEHQPRTGGVTRRRTPQPNMATNTVPRTIDEEVLFETSNNNVSYNPHQKRATTKSKRRQAELTQFLLDVIDDVFDIIDDEDFGESSDETVIN